MIDKLLAGPIDSILDKFIPDAKDKLAAKAELARLADAPAQREHIEAMGQIETNKIEAAHASVFVSGWRPALGWIGATGAGVAFVLLPLNAMLQAWWYEKAIPVYPTETLMGMILYLLGASGIRSFEKLKGTAFSNLGQDPGMAMTKKVEGTATPGVSGKLPIATHDGPPPTPAGDKSQEASPVAPAPFTAKAASPAQPAGLRPILWGAKVPADFRASVLWIEQDLGLNADNLMCCMAFETGGKFKANVRNLAGSSGTGLIQFMEFTAKRLGTTTAKLAKMTEVQQLNYVWKYFNEYKQRGFNLSKWTLEDTYMAILYPKAIGKPLSWPFPWRASGLEYRQNRGLDLNKDGIVTKAEACAKVVKLREAGAAFKG